MKRRDHPLRFKPKVTPIPLWCLFLILVVLSALLLPGSQRLLAAWNEPVVAEMAGDDWALAEPLNGVQPSLASSQETAPPVARSTQNTYVVEDPNAYVHTVRLGEYWIGIAQHFGLEYPELRTANPELWELRGEVIRPGDQMVIPTLSADEMGEPIRYTVAFGDSWYKIAEAFGVSYWDLRLDNLDLWKRRGIYIRPGDEMVVRGVTANVTAAESEARAEEVAVEETTPPAEEDVTPPAEEAQQPAETTETPVLTPAEPAPSTGSPLPPSSAPPPIVAPETPPGSTLYTVRPGDSWFSIAATYGIPFIDLRTANPELWSTRGQSLRVGDQLVIPPHGSPPPPPEIRLVPMEPEETPAAEEGAEEGVEQEESELSPAPPDEVTTPEPQSTPEAEEERVGPMQAETPEAGRLRIELAEPTIIYVVQAGEDWASIAAKTGVTVEALQAANPALGTRALMVGDQLRLP
jgi:LysM repeat protein